jgi:hypothetical protein
LEVDAATVAHRQTRAARCCARAGIAERLRPAAGDAATSAVRRVGAKRRARPRAGDLPRTRTDDGGRTAIDRRPRKVEGLGPAGRRNERADECERNRNVSRRCHGGPDV